MPRRNPEKRKAYMKTYLKEYNQRPEVKERHRESCRAWRRANPGKNSAHQRRCRYGISADEIVALGEECHVCGAVSNGRALDIDHDHKSGSVRGLLCRQCNLALGALGDDPGRALLLFRYIRKHTQRNNGIMEATNGTRWIRFRENLER